jgi:general secretion pathway protein A
MYQHFFGLTALPFELTPDTRYLFLPPRHREALSTLEYGLSAAKPLTLLIGDAGTGKTTLFRAALESSRCSRVRCVCLTNPLLSPDDFVRTLASRFELGPTAADSKAVLLEGLEQSLLERRARGDITALVVDEAQSLTTELLEEIRLLANIETPKEKLLPLVLAGQPELAARLEESNLRQLKQRVTLRCELEPFDLHDTAVYVGARITAAGGAPAKLFTREAVTLIYEYSRGIPRTINVLCDNALLTAMGLRRQVVDRQVVLEVGRDLALDRTAVAELRHPALDATAVVRVADDASDAVDQEQAGVEAADDGRKFTLRSLLRRNTESTVPHVVAK